MQNTLEYKKTEKFAMEEAEREAEWQKIYATKIQDVIEKMDNLLKIGTTESRLELHDMFLHKDFFGHYKQTDTIATMYVVMQIYEREIRGGYNSTILDLDDGTNVADLIAYLQKIKFILYRIDFNVDEVSEKEFVEFIKKYQTSVITLETMFTTAVMRPMQLALKLETIFEKNAMYKELFWVRSFINERWSGNHRIILKLAELYHKTGHIEYVTECISQIPEDLQLLYRQNEKYLSQQENMWKLYYKDMESLNGIMELCRNRVVPVEAWTILLNSMDVNSEEYYLVLANEFLERKMIDYASETLRVGKKAIPQNHMIDKIYNECQKLMR